MARSEKHILEDALKLDPRERLRLVADLQASLEDVELGGEWEAEIQRRLAEVDAGRMNTIPGDIVMARLKQRFRAR